ncbi:guanine nucleotide-binding protein subunit alpha-15 isoform X2 [Bombina bombina]|nr:guanine nucleotide-binding protein subunit alpha-15 isoform X2 [Bombina bombina]
MRIIHGLGFSEQDRKLYARLVHQNIVTCTQSLLVAMETLQVPYSKEENKVNARLIQDLDSIKMQKIEKHHAEAISKLWSDSGIKLCYERRREFQLLDSANYYFSNLERLTQDGYQPTNEDILRIRIPTTGINEYCFTVEKVNLRIVDVGGQKSERRKWIHAFENLKALIYLASLSEYDQQLEENDKDNRMWESLALFRSILVLPWFVSTAIILFLNKTDLLAEKIISSDLATYFPNFKGPQCNAEAAKQFILSAYNEIFKATEVHKDKKEKKSVERMLYPHFTCATDTQNIRKVFNDVKEAVLIDSLRDFNLV